jgi:hypothetical protein
MYTQILAVTRDQFGEVEIKFLYMKNMKCLLLLSFFFISGSLFSQAELTIENNSMRMMTIKVMRAYGASSSLFKQVDIAPNSSKTVYFNSGGTYFTKTKAVLSGKDPIYQKGQRFEVTNDRTGYSILTLTFTIKESQVPQTSGGAKISKSEFDND